MGPGNASGKCQPRERSEPPEKSVEGYLTRVDGGQVAESASSKPHRRARESGVLSGPEEARGRESPGGADRGSVPTRARRRVSTGESETGR